MEKKRKSLWGREGDCLVKEGGPMCTLCCWLLNVEMTDSPRDEFCKHQTKQGCSIHDQLSPESECGKFHCSQISLNMWYGFYWKAAQIGLITEEECEQFRSKIRPMLR